ncbi:MAG: hypothetical protein ABI679_02055 [Gemmatimonadota bacterium]
MFIELTDILRCPAPHDEQYLVLVPERMEHRMVQTGRLGCPVCHREYSIIDGVATFSPRVPPTVDRNSPPGQLDAPALAAFLGLSGPGGYVGLIGEVTRFAADLIREVPGVHFIGVNPPPGTNELPMMSLAGADTIPIRSRSLRGVLLGESFAGDPRWQAEAARSVLPGLRVAGVGALPTDPSLRFLAGADGWWVSERGTA